MKRANSIYEFIFIKCHTKKRNYQRFMSINVSLVMLYLKSGTKNSTYRMSSYRNYINVWYKVIQNIAATIIPLRKRL